MRMYIIYDVVKMNYDLIKHRIHPAVKGIDFSEILPIYVFDRIHRCAETPVLFRYAGNVHPGVGAEAAHILKRDYNHI